MFFTSHNTPDPSSAPAAATVFCAVWHKQEDKEELLRTHWKNLKNQTIPVETCYIFDNGDQAPEWFDGTWYSFSEPLTIYQAWAAGVALSRTRYTMNLNMDDRLASDAVAMLASTAYMTKSVMVGGDWLICFDRSHLDADFGSSNLSGTNFDGSWPPKVGENIRLGSGTSERGTMGPACLWDLAQVGKWYPTNFANSDPILSIGDSIFWDQIMKSEAQIVRIPMIIGRYHSDSGNQAEFRTHTDFKLLRKYGVHKNSFALQITGGHVIDTNGCTHQLAPIQTAVKDLGTVQPERQRFLPEDPNAPQSNIDRLSRKLAAALYQSMQQSSPMAAE